MTIVLHPAPSARTVLEEQLRITGMRARVAAAVLLAVLLVVAAGTLRVAWTVREACRLYHACATVNYSFSPQLSILLAGVALLLPLIVWQDEDPTRQLYFSAMPISRGKHALLRVAGGWLWLMLTVVVFLLGMLLVKKLTEWMTGTPQRYDAGFSSWEWLVPFTSATIAYMLASAAAVGTRRPIVWIFGLPLLYASLASLLYQMSVGPSREMARNMSKLGNGYFGAVAAMAGQVDAFDAATRLSLPTPGRWLGATCVWLFAAAVLLAAVMRRRPQPAA